MCNKNSPPPTPIPTPSDTQTNSIMKKTQNQTKDSSCSCSSSLKPLRRRNRTKTRKPKFLSLRLQLSQSQNQPKKMPHQQHQLNLFPLHPVNLVEDKDMQEENNVALLFSSEGGATLNGLLEDESTTATTATTSEEGSFSPPALTCPMLNGSDNGSWLVRKAMRRRNEEGSEERWVCYSEVVEKKELVEEVTSYCAAATASAAPAAAEDPLFWCGGGKGRTTSFGLLSLKLDHEGILNAWSDKGSLYVAGEAPQTVPYLHYGVLLHNAPNVAWDGWGSDVVGNKWAVPEDCGANKMKLKEEMGWKLGQREASVLRYKEKRQSRLFSKRIRYEVRKLNAEKRPRMKGRFVKRE